MKRQLRVDFSESDEKYVADFMHDVALLAGVVLEMVRDDPRTLLSPVMRELLINQAVNVRRKRENLAAHTRLLVDNPGRDLSERIA